MRNSISTVEDIYPLSPMQAGMLFHALYDETSPVHFVQLTWGISGELQVPAFQKAWQTVIQRYPILRTSFSFKGLEKPLQVVRRDIACPWVFHDWARLGETEQKQELQRYLDTDKKRGFDLSEAPLMRLHLIKTGRESHYFICSFHHLLLDGWSFSLVVREVLALYGGFSQGSEVQLDPPPAYKEYIAWLTQQDVSRAKEFWQKSLKGFRAPTPIRIRKEKVSGVQHEQDYCVSALNVPEQVTADLLTLARQHQVTLSTLIHGAWAILLSRYSGEEDVVFGATVAARPAELSGIESMVGLFVNTLPVRIRTPLDALLLDWLKEVQREQFKARSYEYSQLAEVQRCSDVPAGIPLFETILVFENYPVDKALRDGAKAAGLGIEALGWTEQTNFPLTLAVYPGRQLQLKAAYDRNLYPTDAIERMLGHLTTLLQRISKCADERVRDLSLLGDQEKRQLLEEWNQTESDFPREKCIHELFEDQVGRTPGAVAVEYENEELTYEQLDRRAGQLSRQLQELGIGPDKLVGICAKRSLEMIIGLLGVLKAGGAYVPIDPEYPEERMAFMLQDTQASVLLTQQELLPRLPAFSGSILSLDRPLPDLDESRRVHSRPRPNPGNLAYVIYTSGSTGKPKGVQIHHAGLCNTITTTARTFHLDSNSRVAQVASFTFDASVAEIFGALTTGASLHLLNASSLLTPLEFRNLLLDKRINFIGLSPSLLNVLEEDEFPQLQTIAVGGETCSLQTAGKWGKGRKFFNAYAPTESTVFSTIFDCSGKYDGVVPVGRPVANAQVYILDREMQPSPVGIPGELHLGGVGLARGYLNLPDLTAERFVANPFSAASGERLYKTGDMARRQPDGNIEFLGRIDSQVKIRGFRIELGEVETVLQQHQDIENAVVIVREDLPGDKRLVAYISLKEHHHRAEKELKAYLAAKLPDYMVPGAIVELEAFPLTSNGKVDRNLLPAPELVRRETGQDYVAPRTTTEEMLEALWAKVLGLKRVGRDENFFELGGHSLLATQIISRLRHTWAINLPLKILFEDPTIAGLGRAIDRFGGTRSAALPILPVSRDQDLPLSFAQQRLWFLEQLEAGNSGYNLSTAVRLKGKLNLSALEKSLDYVVQRHEALRTTFPAVEGRGIQFIHERSAVSLELIDLRATKDGEQRTADLLMESAQSAFDLSRGPLFRTLLLQLGDEEHVLQLTTHHIISDGWSMGVLVRETSALYDAFTAGIEPALEELKIQYADYAAWQRDWLKGEVLEAQVNYWRSQLADARVPQLATDYPPGRVASHMGRLEMRVLDRELTEELTGLSRRENVTLFMFLLAAFQVLLWRYTGENDVVVGTPIANRNRQEIENLIGMFVNTLVMRTTLKVDECFQQLLKQVREAALAAYAHQDLPFEKLVDELQPERELSRTPLFQVMFVHQNLPTPQMFLGGLTLSPVEYETEVAQFDLMMVIAEREQGLQIAAQYKSELFSRETIQRLLGHYECLLIGLGASLKQSIHAIPYFSRAERDQLLEEWNHINPQSEPDSCIQQLFEKQAHRTPDAVAVRHNGCESSYRQLNERANQLAHYLRRCGVGPEVYAGICVERSLEMIVGIVAILKAGGAYVPLDPNYPAERLRYTLEDSGAPVLLAQEATANRLPPYSGTLINLDTRWDEVSCESPENPQGATFPENLAYAIYTSGSTGRPKGVAVRHSSVAELLRWAHCVFSPAELQGVLASASICFDLSVFEMFAPLTCGGTVFIAADALELPRMADAAGVTLINTVPSAIRELVRIRAIPESVRTVNLAGEALPAELVRDVYATSRVERVLNLYGPTEDTTYSTFAQPERDAATVTIGRPITNTSSYVLDDWMQPVPVGIVGNLYLGGAGLSRGYWNRPAHTAEKFLPNPFGPGQGERIYATGDLARWRSEGTLEFLGRKDSQVKLRGFRIEPGEIEAVLSKHPQVNNCAVTVRGRTSGEKQLAAFIAATEGSEVTHNDLRAYLKDKLPEYMIPAIFVCLDRLPLTPNGKVDYQSLTLPKDLDSDSEIADLPRTPEEETLCQVWAEVLGVQRVGTRENFFQLGGDSILSIQIVARANRAGLQITPRQIFENQTVAELAMVARRADVIQAEQGIVSGPVPLTPIQQWFFEQELQDPHHFNQAVMLAVRHELDQEILEKVVAGLMRHHDALRMRFRRDSAGQWQEQNGLREDSKTVVDRVDLSRIDEDCRTKELERLAGEWQASLNLESGPLLRFVLFDLGPKKAQRLLVVIHHLVVDGVSWRILLEDLESNYRELRLTGATEFTKKTSSFQQWARWIQEQLAQSKELADEVVYWQKVLAGSIEPLPVDFAKGENTVGSADSIQLQLSEARTQALIQAASRAYRLQVQEVLLAALFGTLSAWSGAKSLVLEIEGHGREEVSELLDVTRTVGWFTTIFPVRLEMSVAEDLGRLLKYVKEVLHNTPQRGLGYGVLRYLHPDRQIREGLRPFRPIEISFNYLGQIDQVLEPEGVFTGAPESSGIVQSPYQKRTHILDITASVQHRELQIQLFYSRNLHQRSTLQGIGDELMRRLDRLTAHCESLAVRQYTPSDFSWVELDQGSLDELLHGGDEVEQIYPLTPMQEGMLFHTVAAEQAGVYFEQLTCILEGELQVEALARAWQQVVDHHEILRSRFAWGVRDQIVRVVEKKTQIHLQSKDWRALPQQTREQNLQEYLRDDLARGFDLKQPPLMRLVLIRVEAKKYWLVWDFHHLLLDGWSLPVVLRDVFASYTALCKGEAPSLDRPSVYKEYARWLRRQDLRKAEEFWRERLKGFHAPTKLGVEKPIEAMRDLEPGSEDLFLSEEASRGLDQLARTHQLTLNTLVQGMWALLLSQYSGTSEVVFGSTISGRPGEVQGIEKLVGVFINTLPVRVRVREDEELIPWLKNIQQCQVEQRQYEYTSLADIQRWSELPGGTPLFSTIVVFENTPIEAALEQEMKDSGLHVASLFRREQTNYPVEVMATPGRKLLLRMIYAKNEYAPGTASQILKHLRDLLESTARNGNVILSRIAFSKRLELPALVRNVGDAVPLSYHQERLWFIDRFEAATVYESSPIYHNIPLGLWLQGPVDSGLLEQAINEVIARHQALQVRIADQGERTVQVRSICPISLKVANIECIGGSISKELAIEWITHESRVPFALSREPLVRATLLRCGAEQSLLVVVVHHIAADRASLKIIASELSEIYTARTQRRDPFLSEDNYSYLDYALWQHRVPDHVWMPAWLYWKQQLGGDRANLELPSKRPRHAIHVFKSASHELSIPSVLLGAVRSFSRRAGTGDMQVFLAAFYALLRIYSGQEDLFVGLPVGCRRQTGTEVLVGPLSNLLAFRCKCIGRTFSELLKAVAESVDGAYQFQEMPFELVTQRLKLPKDMTRTALFDVLFDYDSEDSPSLPFGSAQAHAIETNLGYGKYDLSLHLQPSSTELSATLVYNDLLYDRDAVERMMRHYQVLLHAMSSDPDQVVSRVQLLDEKEISQQLLAWNSTQADYPHSSTIHQLFEQQVALRPENIAVKLQDQQLTYSELNRQANQLAHYLKSQGIAPGMLAAICLDRSLEMIVGIMAVLKAGGAYLPLDPSYPDERLAFMLGDGRVSHLITNEGLLHKFDSHSISCITELHRDWEIIRQQPDVNPAQDAAGPKDLAYCIYTSGSTGQPNGVLVEHTNVVRLLKNGRFQFSFNERDVWTLFHSYTFDFSVWEIFGALAHGGTIVVVPPDLTRDSPAFLDLLCRERVTVLNQTPAAFYNLAACATESYHPDLALRYVIFGGEALQPAHLRAWKQTYPAVKLVNMYGITETTVHVTFREISAVDIEKNTSNIGAPIPTLTTYVMSETMALLPVGVIGELYVGGKGVARGYMNRSRLTAMRFLPDPFSQVPGSRLYRSGDLVRYREDGSMEYMGRADHQVKIRGFRIELGEIETALQAHPQVQQALVLARQDASGEKQLVAYLVSSGKQAPSQGGLRRHLKELLPDYMVPALFVHLERFPLTGNGKVDRKALPEPKTISEGAQRGFVPARTPTEEMLCEIFADVLKVDQVGVDDSFFELGGHSLLAMQLISRIRKVWKSELELRRLFEHPTVAGLAAAIAEREPGRLLPPIHAAGRDGELPLSFAQQRLWFQEQLVPGNSAFSMASAIRLDGKLDIAAVEKSLAEIVRRHESLRTRFVERDGIALQQILPAIDSAQWFERIDLQCCGDAAQREVEVEALAQAAVETPFDLGSGPLLRVKLLQLGPEAHVLQLTMHHIIGDGWSMGVLVREFGALYEVYLNGEDSPLPELKIQYADYAAWQRQWMQGEALEEQLQYWVKQLAGVPRLELPTDHGRRVLGQSAEGFAVRELPPELGSGVKGVARQENATVFMVLLAAWQMLLWRYTGQSEMAVGTPVANRRREETEGLIGFFVNTLVLRVRLDGEESVGELLKRVKDTVLGAYAHQDVPFERVVEALQPDRDLSQTPLFQVMLVLQNTPPGEVSLRGVKVTGQGSVRRGAQYDLTLEAEERGAGEWRIGLHYRRELYEKETAERMLGHYQELLMGMVGSTEQRVIDLRLLRADEEQQLLKDWNRTKTEYPQGKCIHELFEEQVRRRPQAEAVRSGSTELSYGDLNRKANQVGRLLRELGAGPETLVGICVERSPEMMVGVLGILKAGCAYVPLDPAYPQERLRFMMDDARLELLLTREKMLPRLPEFHGQAICLDRDWATLENCDGSNLAVNTTPDNLAYVIYTSGSTGRPKAALNVHRGICNLVQEHRRLFGINEKKTVLQFSSLCFDAATWDWSMALLNGARLVFPSRDEMLGGSLLGQLLRDEQVSIVTLPPSVLELLPEEAKLPDLETIVVAGEACSQQLAARWGCKHYRMHNAYGPSETTVCATVSSPLHGEQTPGIGSPIANGKVYILDERMRPTPIGIPGELHIGGVMLGRGYLNRPDLTAERFIANPFSAAGGERLYKTGDKARWRSDGTVEFLCRLDHQVKLRGFRIELEEIESVLREHDSVTQVVVIAREDRPGEKRLVAYVASAPGAIDTRELKTYAAKKLPDYMVPSALVWIEKLPLTPNGKVDRRALPAPDMTNLDDRPEYVSPRTATEKMLTEIWADVLGLERVGVNDNFFDLGGHSLLATQAISRIRRKCDTEVPLRALFEEPTAARLAQRIDEHKDCKNETKLAPITPVPRGGDLPLSFAQQRIWFMEQLDSGSQAFHMPLAVRFNGPLSVSAMGKSFNEIVRRHESFRTVFASVNAAPVQRIQAARVFPLQVVDLQSLSQDEREPRMQQLLLEHLRQKFELSAGPLARGLLLRVHSEEHVLQLVMHHIISDGWSMGVFVTELEQLYNAYAAGEEPALEELRIQYADFASWQRDWMESAALEQQLGYWKKQLAGMEVTAIASDRRKPGVARHHGAAERLMTSSETRRRLKDLALEHNATLFMVVLAALQVVLHSRTGSVDLSLGTDIANRNRREIEGLIGFFVNTLVLRTSLKGDPPFSDLIERVRETTLGAYTNQDLPFERLVEELRPRRDGGHSPLFRIKVTLGNIPIRATGMHGLQLSLLPPADTIAASDMTFFLGEDEEGISISLVYDADLFEAATAKTVLLGLESVISAVADSPELRVSDLLEHLKEREAQHAQQLQKALESVVYGKLKFRRNPAVPLPSPLPEEKKNDPSRTGRSPEGPV